MQLGYSLRDHNELYTLLTLGLFIKCNFYIYMTAEEVLQEGLEAFAARDAEKFASYFADDVTAYDPQYPEPLRGKDAVKKDMDDFFAALPDLKARILSVCGSDDMAAAQIEITGTNTGPFTTPDGTVPATNKKLTMRVGLFMRTDAEGKIVENNRYYDMMSVTSQLGLV
jgi:steroid delta-isomerase-like uncharacterized protein